jgi:NifU-like protein involved in Fe-S cluster formation
MGENLLHLPGPRLSRGSDDKGQFMAADSDLIRLYSTRILALAADMPHAVRLDDPAGTARRRSPLCGSTVTVDVKVQDGRVSAYGQDVKACALGQAAASVLGRVVVGLTEDQIRRGRDELLSMLKEGGPVPAAPFTDFVVLEPARDYKNRHASIMLAFEATLDALAQAKEGATRVS